MMGLGIVIHICVYIYIHCRSKDIYTDFFMYYRAFNWALIFCGSL